MDLFAILQSLRRHWVLTGVVVLLTFLGAVALVTVMPRHYEARASFVLVNPQPGPTENQIAADPALEEVNRNNPYLRFSNQATVSQVLSARMSGDTVRESLLAAGADGGYTAAPSLDFGGSGYIIDVVGTGTSPEDSEKTLDLVSRRMQDELTAMQKVYNADDSALVTVLPVAEPTGARLLVSGTVRSLVGLGAVGVIVLFAAISVSEARRSVRESARPSAGEGPGTGRRASRHRSDHLLAADPAPPLTPESGSPSPEPLRPAAGPASGVHGHAQGHRPVPVVGPGEASPVGRS
jgi:hypothetical protein